MGGILTPNNKPLIEPLVDLGENTPVSEEEQAFKNELNAIGRVADTADFQIVRERWIKAIEAFKTGAYIEDKAKLNDAELGEVFRHELMMAEFLQSELDFFDTCLQDLKEGAKGEGKE